MAHSSKQETSRCRRCGEPLAGAELSGNCPRCLATLLLSPEPAEVVESAPLSIVRRLGDYELLEEVARGGMGVVFRARQLSLGREVAVKVLRDAWLATPLQVKRFQAEAANAARLKHPNIVAVHDVGEQGGQHYFAMDLVKGQNLAELTREGPLPPRQAAELVKKVAEAVQHAHEAGVLHRDLKPSNVLLDAQGEPQVTDFGLARPMDDESSLTLTGQVLGTPGYIAPEQAKGGGAVGPAADVYGLGAVLFHLLTGRAPFMGASAAETLTQVLQQEPLSPRLLNSAVSVDLAAVCLKCLRKTPRERYSSARELAADLERFLENETTQARPEGPLPRGVRWCRRKPGLATAVIALHVVGLLGLAGILWQWRRAEREARTAKEELWHAQLLEARSHRLNGGFGQRTRDLEIIARAAAYRPSVELRNEAIAALVLPDVGPSLWWHTDANPAAPSTFTRDLEFFLPINATGHVAVCQASNQQPVVEFEGPAASICYSQFSPDARLLAVRFHDGAVRVWDWRARRLVFAASSWLGFAGDPAFDFTPDSRELWVAGPDLKLGRYALPAGTPLDLPTMAVSATGIRLDRAGRRLVAFVDKTVSAWDLTTGERLGAWTLPGDVWRVAWHPQGHEFAVGTDGPGVFIGEIGQTNLDWLEASGPGSAPTSLTFTPDGSLVLLGGWGNVFTAWDVATRKRALWSRQQSLGQLSDDGQRVALFDERRGYGIRAFLNPVGVRRLRVPGLWAGSVHAAAWHPGGKWLAIASDVGWGLWGMKGDEPLAVRRSGYCRSLQFMQDGSGILTGGTGGPVFWPLTLAEGKLQIGEPRRLLPENSGANERAALSPDGTRFAAVGQQGAFLGELAGDSAPLPIPGGAGHDTIEFSPDGRWLRIGGYHENVVHFHSMANRTLVTNLPTGSSSAMLFVPNRDELLVTGPNGFSFWRAGTWQKLRELPVRDDSACSEFVGFYPDGVCALANGKDQMLRMWDLELNRELACLRLPEGSAAWGCVFDPSGRFMATTSSHPFLRLWNFIALRRELRVLDLDWPDAEPGRGFVAADRKLRAERTPMD